MGKPKWTDVAIVVLAAGVVFLSIMQWRATRGAAHEDQIARNAVPAVVQASSPVNEVESDEEDNGRLDKSTDHVHDWIDKLNAGSTAVIAVFTVFLFFGVRVQIRTSRATERAWIIGSPAVTSLRLGFIPSVSDPIGSDQRNVFLCSIKNTGNTPARLIDAAVWYRHVARWEDIPHNPEYGQRNQLKDLPLVKNDSFGLEAYLEPNDILAKPDKLAIEAGQQFVYAYGVITYKDVFGKNHETRFGYAYHFPRGGDPVPSGFRREELPTSYNRAT